MQNYMNAMPNRGLASGGRMGSRGNIGAQSVERLMAV